MGKRVHAQYFLDEHRRPRGRGLQLPARARHGDGSDSRLRDRELGAGLRRLRAAARSRRRCVAFPGSRGRRSSSATSPGMMARPSGRRRGRCSRRRSSARASLGYEPMFGSELEFYLLKESYEEAHAKHYRDLTPSVPYILDYHVLATTYDEPLIRQIRNGMYGAGITVESSKGEAWPGQHEINFRFADAVTMADNHVDLQERRQGDRAPERLLDHVHGEARPHVDRQLVPRPREPLARRRERVRRRARRVQAVPRRLDRAREGAGDLPRADDQLVQALRGRDPGRRRRSPGGTTTARAGSASSGTERRSGSRRAFPGGDVNPYLAFAALIAAGLHGIEAGLELPPRAGGERVRVGCRAVPVDVARGDRGARARDDRARGARRRRRRPLPELRAHRAAAVRRGRDVLRAGAAVRAWLRPRRRHHDVRHSGEVEPGTRRRRSCPSTTCMRSSARAGARCSCRRARTESRRRSRRWTGWSSPAAPISIPSLYDQEPHPETVGIARGARPRRARAARGCARARHAGARDLPRQPGAERRARRRPRPAPPGGRRRREAQAHARARSRITT